MILRYPHKYSISPWPPGVPADAPVEQIAELVRQTYWFRPDTGSPWFFDRFFDVAWDPPVAALRPGGQEIAVLAATATD
ncbi:DUF6183 family protein [Kitasatospora sp. NPDC051914]|uniref:DUF6183 family protein n=1 Tax=Kitasatospora sp. NPDC051914 TaxID=3154945 RepID=UPI003429204F